MLRDDVGLDARHGEYTDAIWVYWSRDLNHWNMTDKVVVLDGSNCTWSKACIGLPAVMTLKNRLAILYDAPGGNGTSHMPRDVGLAWLNLPLKVPTKEPCSEPVQPASLLAGRSRKPASKLAGYTRPVTPMHNSKPIIGIAGGIGSGKSFVADLFGEIGCCVIHADDQIREAYSDLKIQRILRQWWGDKVFRPDGSGVDRGAVAQRIFSDESDRKRLENLLHPWIAGQRDRIMGDAAQTPAVKAFVWDTPLLFEADLAKQCDAVVYVDTPEATRFDRVKQSRGWEPTEIIRREKLQWPLDKKRKMAHYVIVNTADAADCRSHVREILSRILAK